MVARWIVKPVTLVTAAVQVRITERLLPLPFAPLAAVKLLGAAGMAGTGTAPRFEKPDVPAMLVAATR